MKTGGNWYQATRRDERRYPALDGDIRVAAVVVGGGYTGLGTALRLAQKGVRVALAEAHRIGWGASGRNGGQVHIGQRQSQRWLEAKLGQDRARGLWQIALDAREGLDAAMAEHRIACDFTPGLLHLDHKRRYVANSRAEVEHLRKYYNHDSLDFVDADRARALVDSPGYHGGTLDRRGGQLHALDLADGFARAAATAGALLFENTSVETIEGDASGFRLKTPRGTISADRVVIAANGYLDGLVPLVADHVMPIANYIAVTQPLGEARARALIAEGLAVSDSRFVVYYFRMTPDHRLLFGGGETYSLRPPPDIAGFVRPHMLRVFPQLRDVRIDHAWGGTLAVTPTRLPYVGEVKPGLVNVSGFSGLGVVLAPWLGRIAADHIAGGSDDFDLLATLPVPVFPGGRRLRAPTLAMAMRGAALLDRL